MWFGSEQMPCQDIRAEKQFHDVESGALGIPVNISVYWPVVSTTVHKAPSWSHIHMMTVSVSLWISTVASPCSLNSFSGLPGLTDPGYSFLLCLNAPHVGALSLGVLHRLDARRDHSCTICHLFLVQLGQPLKEGHTFGRLCWYWSVYTQTQIKSSMHINMHTCTNTQTHRYTSMLTQNYNGALLGS